MVVLGAGAAQSQALTEQELLGRVEGVRDAQPALRVFVVFFQAQRVANCVLSKLMQMEGFGNLLQLGAEGFSRRAPWYPDRVDGALEDEGDSVQRLEKGEQTGTLEKQGAVVVLPVSYFMKCRYSCLYCNKSPCSGVSEGSCEGEGPWVWGSRLWVPGSCSQTSPPCQVLASRCFSSTARCHSSCSQAPPCCNLNQNHKQQLFRGKVASQCCVSACGLLGFGGLLSQAARNAVGAVLALGFGFQLLRFLLGLWRERSHAGQDEL